MTLIPLGTLELKLRESKTLYAGISYLRLNRYACNFVPKYKTCIETRHENRDRLGPSEMGQADYLLTLPRRLK